ncbi:hypothetical protein QE152_g38917 [Popillia japonica]|uniref:Uncharacterized protein n=1 Tax=Popillia japonica TaxID=7064 RepID=A0AAW1HV71_POPJA
MKKILMKTKIVDTGYVINEEYEISDDKDPREYAQGLIDSYNATLRPKESPRELLKVSVIKEQVQGKKEHSWEKQNLVTISRGGKMYDIYKCTCCGITGKQYGLSGKVTRDPRYKADKYQYCQD